jgi:hypothetical protein
VAVSCRGIGRHATLHFGSVIGTVSVRVSSRTVRFLLGEPVGVRGTFALWRYRHAGVRDRAAQPRRPAGIAAPGVASGHPLALARGDSERIAAMPKQPFGMWSRPCPWSWPSPGCCGVLHRAGRGLLTIALYCITVLVGRAFRSAALS